MPIRLRTRKDVICLFVLIVSASCAQAPADSRPGSALKTDTSVAIVNGVGIPRVVFDEAAKRLAGDRREALSDSDREKILASLVDEELLVQYGLSQGLARDDHRVRAAIVSSVIDKEKSFPCVDDCSGDDLQNFYRKNADLFRSEEQIQIATLWFSKKRGDDAHDRAASALRELRDGKPMAAVATKWADAEIVSAPSALMPPGKLADYLGGEVARVATTVPENQWSEPIDAPDGVRLVFVVQRVTGEVRPFAEVEDQIRFEAQQAAHEQAVESLVAKLRKEAGIDTTRGTPR